MLASLCKGRRFANFSVQKSKTTQVLGPKKNIPSLKSGYVTRWNDMTFQNVKIRFYGHHHPPEEEIKVIISEPKFPQYKAIPTSSIDEATRKQQIDEVEGLIYGGHVTYINSTKTDDTYAESANGWIFGKKPRAPGEPYQWEEWEPISVGTFAVFALLCLVYLWAKPETSINLWAREEIEERRILKKRVEEE